MGPGPEHKPPCGDLLGRRLYFILHGFHFSSLPPLLLMVAFQSVSTFAAPPSPHFPTSLHCFPAAISSVCMAACSAPSRLRLPSAHASSLARVLRRSSPPAPSLSPALPGLQPPVSPLLLLCLPQPLQVSFRGCFHHCLPAVPLQLGVTWASSAVAVLRHQSCAQLLPWLLCSIL